MCRTLWLLIIATGPTASVGRGEERAPASPPKPAGQKNAAFFSPGVRINWKALQVEIDSTVVLRKGPLELLACSPKTREHESILTVSARPLDIYHALGLIGLEPGSPVSYDPQKEKWGPPTGERLKITARYDRSHQAVVVDVRDWLLDVATDRPPADLHWVFAGSRTVESGTFGGDLDGTIICVVDFDTALIAIDTTRTASNENLWLRANTDAIPPIGTRCTLIIRGTKQTELNEAKALHVIVGADGRMSHQKKPITPVELARLFHRRQDGAAKWAIILQGSADVSVGTLNTVIGEIVAGGVAKGAIRTERPSGVPPTDADSTIEKPGG